MKKFFLFATLACSLNAFAQKATVSPSFQKGQKLEVLTTVNSNVSMEMMGQTIETKVDASVTRLFDVENVENGSATLEHKIKRLQMNIEAPGGSQSFDSEKAEDMQGEGGKAMEKAIKSKFSMQVDPSGKVTSVKADNDYPGKNDSNPMAGPMGNVGELPKVGSTMELVILPAGGVEKGSKWSDTTGGHQYTYTVTDMTGDEITLSFTDQSKTDKKQEMNGMELNISTTDKTSGTIKVDRKSGLVKERVSTTNSEGTMEMIGQSVPMTTTTKMTMTVK